MTGTATLNALLVEDNEDTRHVLIEAMEALTPYRFVGIVTDETSARQWLQSHEGEWTLAIVDLRLPDGSGLGVLKACQSRSPMQKVVVLTGFMNSRLLRFCRDLGADEIFDKSLDIENLINYCGLHAAYVGFMQDHGLVAGEEPV
ncbi:MAG: response regulator [Pseudomonadota bacterium]